MLYSLIKKILFTLPPESVHAWTLQSLQLAYRSHFTALFPQPVKQAVTFMGLNFANRVGLAAGYDRNGEYIDGLAMLGFGFIEIGTVVPQPQTGNAKPRILRFPEQLALINRVGFASLGADYVRNQLKKTKYRGILGVNIGKNKETPIAKAVEDYLYCFNLLAPFASYITINISSPNTIGLRELQAEKNLTELVQALKHAQQQYLAKTQKYVPLVVKIAPDLNDEELQNIANTLLANKIDGVIATNTTLARDSITLPHPEVGGLSGLPLFARSTAILKKLHTLLNAQIPIIACGGVMDTNTAQEKFTAGASLLQVYTGLIYAGPGLVRKLALVE